jgi:hypothetical protein
MPTRKVTISLALTLDGDDQVLADLVVSLREHLEADPAVQGTVSIHQT